MHIGKSAKKIKPRIQGRQNRNPQVFSRRLLFLLAARLFMTIPPFRWGGCIKTNGCFRRQIQIPALFPAQISVKHGPGRAFV